MTPERAQEIWRTRMPFGEFNASPEEFAYVRGIWVRMPGHTCWADALLLIANGQAENIQPMTGTAVFYYGDEIVEQTPVYGSETEFSPSVESRARRSIEMLGTPASDPVHGRNARLQKFVQSRVKFYPLGK